MDPTSENQTRADGSNAQSVPATGPAETTVEATVAPEPVTLPQSVQQGVQQGPGAMILIVAFAIVVTLLARRFSGGPGTRVGRRLPLIYAGIWLVALIAITTSYVDALTGVWLLLFAAAALAFFVSVGGLRAVLAGVVMTFEDRVKVGDSIRVGDVEGEVIAFQVRCVRLRAPDGTILEVPNQKFVTETIANLGGDGDDSACEVTMRIPDNVPPEKAVSVAQMIAAVTPFASPRHRPEVFVEVGDSDLDDTTIRIRGFAFDQAHQDHYRSDVSMRLKTRFARISESSPANGKNEVIRDLVLED